MNEVQKTVRITYGNNSIELTVEDDGIHISTGNKQIILDSDVRRDSNKPFEHNSLIIKQDLDEHIEETDEKFVEIDESIESIQQQTESAISKTNELENDISGIENDIENLNSTTTSLQDDINTVGDDISHIKIEINAVKTDVSNVNDDVKNIHSDINALGSEISNTNNEVLKNKEKITSTQKDVNKNTSKISQTNDRLSGHIVSNDKEFTDINKKIDDITDSTRGIQSAKKAYDILAERYRILLNERKKVPQKPTHTPKQRVIKKVGWELILQKAYQELWEEGNKYPSKYEVLQRAYLIDGYDINMASKLASYDIGGYPVNNVFINSFADC